jgi:hypothetical protein
MELTSYLTFGTALLIIGGMALVIYQKTPFISSLLMKVDESSRGDFTIFAGKWKWILSLAAAASMIVFYYLFTNQLSPSLGEFSTAPNITPYIILSMVVVTFTFTISAWTDAINHRASAEVAYVGIALTAAIMLTHAIIERDWEGVGSALIFGIIPAALWWYKGIGDADIRLLWVAAFGISWWSGFYMAFMFFGIACVIQAFLHFTYRWHKWGYPKYMKPNNSQLFFRKLKKKILRNSNVKLTLEPEKRIATPLVPALWIGYVVFPCLALVTGYPYLLINGGFSLFNIPFI